MINRRLPIIAVLIWSIGIHVTTTSRAQIPGMKVYTRLDGYPGSAGYNVSQDQRGFIWIGTDNGVACFDGRKFTVIDAGNGLPDKEILRAEPVDDSTVLLSPLLNNLAIYRKGKIITQKEYPPLGKVKNTGLNHPFKDPITQKVYICDAISVGGPIPVLSSQGMDWISVDISCQFRVAQAYNNQLFLGLEPSYGAQQPAIFDLKCGEMHTITLKDGTIPHSRKDIYWDAQSETAVMTSDDEKTLQVYKLDSTFQLDSLAEIKSTFPVLHALIDRNHCLWLVLAKQGFYYCGPVDENLTSRKPLLFLNNVKVNDVFVDRDNHVWITTRSQGLVFISARHWENALITSEINEKLATPGKVVLDSNDQVWVTDIEQEGLVRIKGLDETLVFKGDSTKRGFRSLQLIGNRAILGKNGGLYLTSENAITGEPEIISYPYHFTFWGSVKDIEKSADDCLLVATHRGASVLKAPYISSGPECEIFHGRTTCALQLHNGTQLIGTPNGVYRYADSGTFLVDYDDNTQMCITDMYEIQPNQVLVGTNGRGLYHYDAISEEMKQVIGTKDLSSAYIREIYSPTTRFTWLSTDKGIFRCQWGHAMEKADLQQYTFIQGLPSDDVTSLCLRNDSLFAATARGLAIFPVQDLGTNYEAEAPTYVTRAVVNDSMIHFPKSISFSYSKGGVVLQLSTLSYQSYGHITYRYRITNWSDRWNESQVPEINLSYLPPGNYQVSIEAIGQRGNAISTAVVLPVHVLPLSWQTWWFKGLMVAIALWFIGVLVFFWSKRYRAQLTQRAEQKRQLAELELQAIKAHINPHFIANCLNSVQFFHLKNRHAEAAHYLDLFARLINQTLHNSQETFITVAEEVRYLQDYLELEKMRFGDSMDYEIQVQSETLQTLMMPSMLVQPYVENALKHAMDPNAESTGRVYVIFTEPEPGTIQVEVEDNGTGVVNQTKSQARKPLGMRLSSGKAQVYNELFQLNIDVKVNIINQKSTNARATTNVIISIPSVDHAISKLPSVYC